METSRLRKRMPVTALTDPKIVLPAIGYCTATELLEKSDANSPHHIHRRGRDNTL